MGHFKICEFCFVKTDNFVYSSNSVQNNSLLFYLVTVFLVETSHLISNWKRCNFQIRIGFKTTNWFKIALCHLCRARVKYSPRPNEPTRSLYYPAVRENTLSTRRLLIGALAYLVINFKLGAVFSRYANVQIHIHCKELGVRLTPYYCNYVYTYCFILSLSWIIWDVPTHQPHSRTMCRPIRACVDNLRVRHEMKLQERFHLKF